MPDRLPADTHMGPVTLTVRDVDTLTAFYERVTGLVVHAGDGDRVALGAPGGEAPLVILVGDPAAPSPGRATGLFHLALLVPGRAALGQAMRRVAEGGWRLTGASDHYVSEAIYTRDPEGNGIEIYRDRPREEWRWQGDEVDMVTVAMDMDGVLAAAGTAPTPALAPEGTTIGHVHLSVGDLPATERFYRDVVGFDRMVALPGQASFLAAGGYHHHLGMNVWAGTGLPAPPPGALGLASFAIVVPQADERAALLARAQAAGAEAHEENGTITLRDPAGLTAVVTGG